MDAEQAVTAAQVVVEEAEGTPLGQRYQPDGELGEFNRQWIEIDAVEAAFGDEAAGDYPCLLLVARLSTAPCR